MTIGLQGRSSVEVEVKMREVEEGMESRGE